MKILIDLSARINTTIFRTSLCFLTVMLLYSGFSSLHAQSDEDSGLQVLIESAAFSAYQNQFSELSQTFNQQELRRISSILNREISPEQYDRQMLRDFHSIVRKDVSPLRRELTSGSVLLSEDFEDATFPPAGWELYLAESESSGWERSTDESFSGAASAIHDWPGNHESWLISPQISLNVDAMLAFYEYGGDMTFYSPNGFSGVLISEGSGNPADGDFVLLHEFDENPDNSWSLFSQSLVAYTGKDIYIAFLYVGFDSHYWYLDDVTIFELSDEPAAVDLQEPADQVEVYPFVTLSWTDGLGSAPDYYEVFVSQDPANFGAGAQTTELNYTLNNLDSEGTYYWYVVAHTNAGLSSPPSETRSFTVKKYFEEFPFTETFDDDSPTRDLWHQIYMQGTNNWTFGPGAENGGSGRIEEAFTGTKNARFHRSPVFARRQTILVTPPVQTASLDSPALLFYYAMDQFSPINDENTLSVHYRIIDENGVDDTDWIELFSNSAHTPEWTPVLLDLPEDVLIEVGFWGNHQDSDDIILDNVMITDMDEFTNVEPAVLVAPLDESTQAESPELAWADGTIEDSHVTGYKVYMDNTYPPETLVYDGEETTYQTSDLTPGHTYYWKAVPYNNIGASPSDESVEIWSFTMGVMYGMLNEDFESNQIPAGWRRGGQSGAWNIMDFEDALSGSKVLRLAAERLLVDSNNHDPVEAMLHASIRTPALDVSTGNSISFNIRNFEEDINFTYTNYFQVLYSPDDENWTALTGFETVPDDWQEFTYDISQLAEGNYYFAIGAYRESGHLGTYNVLIDDVAGPQISPNAPALMYSENIPEFATNVPVDYELSIRPEEVVYQAYYLQYSGTLPSARIKGSDPQSFRVYMDTNPEPETLLYSGPFTFSRSHDRHTIDLDLEHGTIYYYKIVTSNSAGETESDVRAFFTVQENVLITGFPYIQDFDYHQDPSNRLMFYATGWKANNWSQWRKRTTDSGNSDDNGAGPRNPGTQYISYERSPVGGNGWIQPPPAAVPAGLTNNTDFLFSFWHRTFWGNGVHFVNYRILLSVDGENFDTVLKEVSDNWYSTNWVQEVFYLGDYAGETIHIRLEHTGGSAFANRPIWHLDDFHFGAPSSGPVGVEEPDGTPGAEGFYLVGNPVQNATTAELFEPVWTQGFPGADSPDYGQPNIYLMDEPSNSYVAVFGADYMPPSGTGMIAYIFDDDNFDGTPNGFPKTMELFGPSNTGDIVVPLSYESEGWNLLGNPYANTINLHEVTLADYDNISGFAWRYSIANDDWYPYDLFNHTDPYFSSVLGRFTGFMVEATGANASFTFRNSWQNNPINWLIGCSGPANGNPCVIPFGSREVNEPPRREVKSVSPPMLSLKLVSEEHRGRTFVMFPESVTQDREGSSYMQPLTMDMTGIFSLIDNEPQMMRYIERDYPDEVTISLGYFTTAEGPMELSWEFSNDMPDDWQFHLTDLETNTTVEMVAGQTYNLIAGEGMNKNMSLDQIHNRSGLSVPETRTLDTGNKNAEHIEIRSGHTRGAERAAGSVSEGRGTSGFSNKEITELLQNPRMKIGGSHRFEITVSKTATDIPADSDLPFAFNLYQNYPNPFNPATQIRYDLPESADVRLEIFDMLGQRVATLVREQQQAGAHTVSFDAGRLSSGVYLYRMRAGEHVFTRKLTIIK